MRHPNAHKQQDIKIISGKKRKDYVKISREEVNEAMKRYFSEGGKITNLDGQKSEYISDGADYAHDWLLGK